MEEKWIVSKYLSGSLLSSLEGIDTLELNRVLISLVYECSQDPRKSFSVTRQLPTED